MPLCRRAPALALLISLGLLPPAHAHSGGLNAQGCHGGSRPYHCHRAPSEVVITATGHTRLRCDLGSASRECAPGSAPGSARGTSRDAPRVLNLQLQLRRHCSGLPFSFADGRYGPMTRAVLVRFQTSQGLNADGLIGPATRAALARAPNGLCRW